MSYLILGVILIILLLTLMMFFLLKNLVRSVNEKSKNYFVEKVQEYDNLKNSEGLEDKEENKKDVVNTLEQPTISAPFDSNVVENIPDYQVNDFLSKYKEINEKFDFDYVKVISSFIENKKNMQDVNYYESLANIRKKLDFDTVYKLYTTSKEPMIVVKEMLSPDQMSVYDKFIETGGKDFESFINYIDEELAKHDPYFYIEVGSEKENYNYLNPLIKTVVNNNIYKGIIIKYKNQMYDYSLN